MRPNVIDRFFNGSTSDILKDVIDLSKEDDTEDDIEFEKESKPIDNKGDKDKQDKIDKRASDIVKALNKLKKDLILKAEKDLKLIESDKHLLEDRILDVFSNIEFEE